jgi:hypothetical protein
MVLSLLHFDALGFEQSQRKLGVTHLHRQGLTPAGSTAQHVHRLTGNKPQFAQATQRGFAYLDGIGSHARNQRVGSIGKLG